MPTQLLIKFVILTFSFSLVACKELTGESTGANDITGLNKVGGVSYIVVEEDLLLLNGTMANGGTENHHFKLKFNLPEGENLGFHFYSAKDFTGGVKAKFSRVNGKVTLLISLNKIIHTITLDNLVDDVLDLGIDIHNDHSDTHIILWDNKGGLSSDETCVETNGCLYNTEYYTYPNPDPFDPGPWGTQGQASGVYWGVEGNKNLVIELEGPLGALSNV